MERNIIEDAERIEELTENRIPFERACWIALYIQRITSGMTHQQALAAEEEEMVARGTARALEYPQVEQPTPAFCIHGYRGNPGTCVDCQTDAHPTYQHNWKNGRCILRGCKAEQPSLIDMLAAHSPTA